MVLAPETTRRRTEQYAAEQIISIVALATIGLASPTGAFARGGGGGHGGGGFHGGGGGFHAGGGGFTVADLAFAEADFAGAAFSVHTPTVTIPTIMVMTTRRLLSGRSAGPDSLRLA